MTDVLSLPSRILLSPLSFNPVRDAVDSEPKSYSYKWLRTDSEIRIHFFTQDPDPVPAAIPQPTESVPTQPSLTTQSINPTTARPVTTAAPFFPYFNWPSFSIFGSGSPVTENIPILPTSSTTTVDTVPEPTNSDVLLPRTFQEFFNSSQWKTMLAFIDRQNYFTFSLYDAFFSFLFTITTLYNFTSWIWKKFPWGKRKSEYKRSGTVKKLSEREADPESTASRSRTENLQETDDFLDNFDENLFEEETSFTASDRIQVRRNPRPRIPVPPPVPPREPRRYVAATYLRPQLIPATMIFPDSYTARSLFANNLPDVPVVLYDSDMD